jgi:hypothetical protein
MEPKLAPDEHCDSLLEGLNEVRQNILLIREGSLSHIDNTSFRENLEKIRKSMRVCQDAEQLSALEQLRLELYQYKFPGLGPFIEPE